MKHCVAMLAAAGAVLKHKKPRWPWLGGAGHRFLGPACLQATQTTTGDGLRHTLAHGRAGLVGQAIVFRGLPTRQQRRRPKAIVCATHYFDGAAAVAALVFFGAFLAFFTAFLVLVVVALAALLVLAGGVAGGVCANVKGIVATARAIASNLVFIFPSFRRVSSARSQFHVAPEALEAR
jgi:hypothetical protein